MEICYTVAEVRKQVKRMEKKRIDDRFCTDHGISA